MRKRTEDKVRSVPKERKRKHFMNIIDDFHEVTNNEVSGKTVSKLIKSSGGLKRISFQLIEEEKEDTGIGLNGSPRTEKSRQSKYEKSGKCSKRKTSFVQRKQKPKETAVTGLDISDVEKQRTSIHQKLTSLVNPVFTEEEECDVSERADEYSSTILPHKHYFLLKENLKEAGARNLETLTEVTDFVFSNHLMVQKKRRRSYSNIDRFVTHHTDDNYSDKTQILPEGTKLLKPPSKLVELVAQSIDESPDGMLQVQQIYTVLQNRFPYFRYMDKSAISSWRSSVRHALYQKWFQKIKFSLESINSKGCFWSMNYSLSASDWAISQSPACRLKNFPVPSIDPKLTDSDVEEQTESMSESNTDHGYQSETEDMKDVIQIANEYGVTISEPGQDAREEHLPHLNIPSPVKDPDPMLIACVPDWNKTPKGKTNCFLDGSRVTFSCLSPYSGSSACEAFQTPPCSPSPAWEPSQNEFYLFSPLHSSLSFTMQTFSDQFHTPKSTIHFNDLQF
ncbi:uncharacterized protein LOC121380801 [Gigantopelta aegis]|uniref:uncharacterized protein LOC121380801 n=1 Tax=Gigantopelta aegis TaxID=1735272 RepID=UPI001B8883B2|nr:uncharacterized protein LOC121380801 [Gigantopelta aegis]